MCSGEEWRGAAVELSPFTAFRYLGLLEKRKMSVKCREQPKVKSDDKTRKTKNKKDRQDTSR